MNPARKLAYQTLDKAIDAAFFGVSGLYRKYEDRARDYVDGHLVNTYDDRTANFVGGEMEVLTSRNYEKALANIWKAEVAAPYLGLRDATAVEKNAGDKRGGSIREIDETKEMMRRATSEDVRRRFEAATTPEQRDALGWILSLICHGEAYALYTSATLIPHVKGTGSRMGMSLQVMEEAKHFLVLREMLKTLGILKPLHNSARFLFESVARAEPYNRLFGMNVMLESFATSTFSTFANFPGIEDIMHQFHRDEARHVGFPQNYNQAGNIPEHVTKNKRYQISRALMLAPALGAIFDYRPYFTALGMDVFGFFGKFVAKVTRLAERSGMPLPQKRDELLMAYNLAVNTYFMRYEPENYKGFVDYTMRSEGEIDPEMEKLEREIYGNDVFGGIGERRYKAIKKQMDRVYEKRQAQAA
ncbi:MAG: ferritin-like domain-containing protein [Deltaproteobacteria bacterium]|nr:ferritin-like domain-containing protein [Deltaproteobacteria bacterium]